MNSSQFKKPNKKTAIFANKKGEIAKSKDVEIEAMAAFS